MCAAHVMVQEGGLSLVETVAGTGMHVLDLELDLRDSKSYCESVLDLAYR